MGTTVTIIISYDPSYRSGFCLMFALRRSGYCFAICGVYDLGKPGKVKRQPREPAAGNAVGTEYLRNT